MGTFTNIKQYRAVWRSRIKKMNKEGIKSAREGAQLVQLRARSKAPKKTGATIAGIRTRKRSNYYEVESYVSGRFKQNLWANRTPPFRSPRMWWNRDQPTVYGSGPARWTGVPMFWDVSIIESRKDFLESVRRGAIKALSITVVKG